MTSLEYVKSILKKYSVSPNISNHYRDYFKPYIEEWAGEFLVDLKISGSSKKGTAVSNGTDVDLFISLTSTTANTLNEIYESLYKYMRQKGFSARRQNVSIGIDLDNYQIDLVPARRQSQFGNDHSLYVSKTNTWTKTNIETHISHVSNSNRLDEIKLVKIWRNLNQLDFPSFYLELIVIESMYNKIIGNTDANFLSALSYISANIENNRYMDPSNTNNCISSQISLAEKRRIAAVAKSSCAQRLWKDIVS